MLDSAVEYMASGWSVFPVEGKIPANKHGVLEASTEERLATIWFERHPSRGVALATGMPSGVWVLDLDGDEGTEAFEQLQARYGKVPKTVAVKTARGFHLYFAMPADGDIRNSASKVAPGIDVRGSGGYVVLPPSPHPSGAPYAWVKGREPTSCAVSAAPDWLVDLVLARFEAADMPTGPVGAIKAGGRNQALASLAGSMRRRGMAAESILAGLEAENQARCSPPLGDAEVRRIAGSVARYEPTAPPTVNGNGAGPPSDVGPLTWEILEAIADEKQAPVDAVPTPWPAWNRACCGAGGGEGLARSWHVVVGAASGAGKSLSATNIAAHALRAGHQVCMLSLEMTRPEITTRLLSILARCPIRQLEHGHMFSRDAWDNAAAQLLESAGSFRVNERPINSLAAIRDAINREAQEGTRIVIVDYLQLAWVSSADTLFHQITEVSRTIQAMAQEHKITTVGISQVNRRTSSGESALKKEGLMGGSSLENDADQVILLGKAEKQYDAFVSPVTLDKNRHGPSQEWQIRLDPMTLQMSEVLL
jgi:KaiC/GvpD/RAD55 family RecA-like ATPase